MRINKTINIAQQFIEKFKLKELEIVQTNYWIISLRPQQPNIASLILTLKRNCAKMSGMTLIETRDLGTALQKIELLLDTTFRPDKINYLALMMIDDQVHFHVIPRYRSSRKIGNIEYFDNQWPGPPVLQPLVIADNTLLEILKYLKETAQRLYK